MQDSCSAPLNGLDWNLGHDALHGMDTPIVAEATENLSGSHMAVNQDPAGLDSVCIQGLTPAERRAHSNRLAQRRSRNRKQVLAQAAKA